MLCGLQFSLETFSYLSAQDPCGCPVVHLYFSMKMMMLLHPLAHTLIHSLLALLVAQNFNVNIIPTSFNRHGSSNTTFPAEHNHMLNQSWTNGQRLLASVADMVIDIGGLQTVVSLALGFQVNIH